MSYKPPGATKYYYTYVDENGKRWKKVGTSDKRTTDMLENDAKRRVALLREGIVDRRAEAFRDHAVQSLPSHLRAWHADLIAKGRTARHASLSHDRAAALVAVILGGDAAALTGVRKGRRRAGVEDRVAPLIARARLEDLTPDRIQRALAAVHAAGRAAQTVNHYRAAVRAFGRWAKVTGRIRDNPIDGVSGLNVDQDLRHERRILTRPELETLVRSTEGGPDRWGMPGPLRAIAYRVAAATGFRANELRSLTPDRFRLDGPEPCILCAASSTKNRKAADQPLPLGLVEDLRAWLQDKPPGAQVFPLHHETARAMRGDLEAAGIAYENDEGIADFHSLRGYYVSALVRTGASIAEVHRLARHAKPETTLKHYARVAPQDLRRAIEAIQ